MIEITKAKIPIRTRASCLLPIKKERAEEKKEEDKEFEALVSWIEWKAWILVDLIRS